MMVIFYLICSENVEHIPVDTKIAIDPNPFVPQPPEPGAFYAPSPRRQAMSSHDVFDPKQGG